jgi:prepilin-type N-terminal cleavage/methylation domain-containing protein
VKTTTDNQQKGFTLIELLIVISIIAILASILIPTAGKMVQGAKRTKAANNLRQIALAYLAYSHQQGFCSLKADNIHDWAAQLAEHADLNDPRIWILEEDPQVKSKREPIPLLIGTFDHNSNFSTEATFQNYPLSFNVASEPIVRQSASTTPLAWSRGLETSGKWSTDSVYGTKGGYIVYMDGHVMWYDTLNKDGGALTNYQTGTRTSDITQAINGKVLK